jgi:uncharacterized protein YbdZ (MbtH family)
MVSERPFSLWPSAVNVPKVTQHMAASASVLKVLFIVPP